jgi:hypothetical protein
MSAFKAGTAKSGVPIKMILVDKINSSGDSKQLSVAGEQ